MAGYSTSNPPELKDAILRRLGAPVINVEVTQDQIYDCISRAIELFTEYHPDGLNRTFITVCLTEDQAATGIIFIDRPMFAITKVLRGSNASMTMDGTTVTNPMAQFIQGMAGTGAGGCAYNGGGGGMSGYAMFMTNMNQMLDMLDPIQDFWYNSMQKTVRINGSHIAGDVIVFEAWAVTSMLVDESATGLIGNQKHLIGGTSTTGAAEQWDNPYSAMNSQVIGSPELYSEQGVYNVRWVKDFSTCLVKELNGTILKRHQGMQLPGGVTIDGQAMFDEAVTEKAELRQELMDISEPLPIMWG